MGYVFAILGAYLMGCSNMAMYMAKLKNVSLSGGSGNPGTSNATYLMGWGAGIIVGVHDIGKGAVAVLLAQWLFPDLPFIGAVAGVACVVGHNFPVFMGFRGGKGFAAFLGLTLALNWKLALIMVVAVVVISLVTDYLVLGTLTTVMTVPVALGLLNHSIVLAVILYVATAVVLFKHRVNYFRLRDGTEIGVSAMFKKDRSEEK